MALDQFLLDLVAPLKIGDTLAHERGSARLENISAELGLRYAFALEDGALVHIEIAPLDDKPHAARSEKLRIAYRNAPSMTPGAGKALCDAVAARIRRNEEQAFDTLRANQPGPDAPRVRHVRVRRLLERSINEDRHGRSVLHTLSPYVGCLIGCRFCYAAEHVAAPRRLLALADVPWGSYVDVRENAPEILRRELPGIEGPIKFCPIVSDPYQAVERRERLTRACLEVLRDHHEGPVFLLTRSALIEEDLELIASLPEPWVGVSLPTIDDEVRAHFEPRGASIEARLRVLERFRDAGVPTFAIAQPMLPGDVRALASALAERVQSVSIAPLTGEYGAKSDFDAPAYRHAREPAWQASRLEALADALRARGVSLWERELPESVSRRFSR